MRTVQNIAVIWELFKEHRKSIFVVVLVFSLLGNGIQQQCIKARDERFKEFKEIMEQRVALAEDIRTATQEAGLPETITAGQPRVQLTEEQEQRLAALEARFSELEPQIVRLGLEFDPETHMRRGVQLYYRGLLDEAIVAWRRALQLRPDHPEAYKIYNNLGNSLADQGDHEAAIAAYHKALKLKPDFPEAYYNLGSALRDTGDYEAAIAAYHKAIQLKPDFPEAYNNLGVALAHQGDYPAAIAAFNKSLELRADFPPVYYNLGLALRHKGDDKDAITAYRKALELHPDAPWAEEARRRLGELESREGD